MRFLDRLLHRAFPDPLTSGRPFRQDPTCLVDCTVLSENKLAVALDPEVMALCKAICEQLNPLATERGQFLSMRVQPDSLSWDDEGFLLQVECRSSNPSAPKLLVNILKGLERAAAIVSGTHGVKEIVLHRWSIEAGATPSRLCESALACIRAWIQGAYIIVAQRPGSAIEIWLGPELIRTNSEKGLIPFGSTHELRWRSDGTLVGGKSL